MRIKYDFGKTNYYNDVYSYDRKLVEHELDSIARQDIVMFYALKRMYIFDKSSLRDDIAYDLLILKEESTIDARYPYPFSDEWDYSEDITEPMSDFVLDEIRESRKISGGTIDTRYLSRTEVTIDFYRKDETRYGIYGTRKKSS